MLVLSRRLNEKILFPRMKISVQVVAVGPGKVRLGIDAPPEVEVLRAELPDRIAEWGSKEANDSPRSGAEARLRKTNTQLRHRLKAGVADLRLLRRQLQLGLWSDAEETVAKMQDDFRVVKQ